MRLYLMYEVLWYWFVAMVNCVAKVKMRRVKNVSYKVEEMLFADVVYIRLQYFVIYFK